MMDKQTLRAAQLRAFEHDLGWDQAAAWTGFVEDWLTREAATLTERGGVVLLALGSLARAELCFGSDLDLALLVDDATRAHFEDAPGFRKFQHRLLDLGIRTQLTVRSVAESTALAAQDFRVALNLSEARPLCGETQLVESLRAALEARFVQRPADRMGLAESLLTATRARWERFGATVYRTEPNLKLGKGGLRDAATVRWLARALPETRLESADLAELRVATGELIRMRNALFLVSGDRIGALALPTQRAVAGLLAKDTPDADAAQADSGLKETALLRAQFAIARTIAEILELAFEGIEEAGGPSFGPRKRYLVESAVDGAGRVDAFDWIRVACDEARRIPSRVRARLREELRDWSDEALVERALPLLLDPTTGGDELGLFEKLGVLTRIAPAWDRIAFLPRGDASHLYTVDRHSFMVVRLVKRMLHGASKEKPGALDVSCYLSSSQPEPGCSATKARGAAGPVVTCDLACAKPVRDPGETSAPETPCRGTPPVEFGESASKSTHDALILAALLHDIGKGRRADEAEPEGHETIGARLAERLLSTWGMDEETRALTVFLVREHLALSLAAQRLDPRDHEAFSRFADSVGSPKVLDALYVLTLADAAAVKQEPPTRWFLDLVGGTYRLVRRLLEGRAAAEGETDGVARGPAPGEEAEAVYPWRRAEDDSAAMRSMQREARSAVLALLQGEPAACRLIDGLPDPFFVQGDPEALASQVRLATLLLSSRPGKKAAERGARVAVRACGESRDGAAPLYMITLAAFDAPGLLVRITATLAQHNLNLVEASFFSATHRAAGGPETRFALDRFRVEDRYGRLQGRELARFERGLARAVSGALPENVTFARPRVGMRGAELIVDQRSSTHHTLLEVIAEDRPGVAYRLASTLFRHGISIVGGRIATIEGKARDVFHLEHEGGGKVTDPELLERIKADLYDLFD